MPLTKEQEERAKQYFQSSNNYVNTVGGYLKSQQESNFSTSESNLKKSLFERTQNLGKDLNKRSDNITEGIKENIGLAKEAIQARHEQPAIETGLQVAGAAAGAVVTSIIQSIGGLFDVVKNVTPETIKKPVVESIKTGFNILAEKGPQFVKPQEVKYVMDKYNEAVSRDPSIKRDVAAAASLFNAAFMGKDIAEGAVALKELPDQAKQAGLQTAKYLSRQAEEVAQNVAQKIPKFGEQAAKILSSEPDEKVLSVLKETPIEVFDKYINIAESASKSTKAQTGFEYVGEKMSEAAKQLQKQASSLGQQKSAIINQAKVGLEPFTDIPRKTILQLSKLEETPVVKELITKLKSVKNKIQADQWVDEAQDLIYSGTKNLTLAEGSALEKQLKGIVGSFNESLKQTLPESYRVLNSKFSEIAQIKGTLNRALGEVIDGIPTRGASLVKQFFSPSGTKSKELFEFIKQKTGIDLAQGAVLAKFTGELFNDARVRSLLEGNIPTSRAGMVEKAAEFIGEKTGITKKTKEVIRKGTIERARSATKFKNDVIAK